LKRAEPKHGDAGSDEVELAESAHELRCDPADPRQLDQARAGALDEIEDPAAARAFGPCRLGRVGWGDQRIIWRELIGLAGPCHDSK
jgi:hypothetical protein